MYLMSEKNRNTSVITRKCVKKIMKCLQLNKKAIIHRPLYMMHFTVLNAHMSNVMITEGNSYMNKYNIIYYIHFNTYIDIVQN